MLVTVEAAFLQVLEEGIEQGFRSAIGTVLAAVMLKCFAGRRIDVLAGQEIRYTNRKTDDVAACRLEPFALSATSMIALGLARLMRSASWSIEKSSKKERTEREILA